MEVAPAVSDRRPSDRNIAIVTEEGAGIYKRSWHVELIRDSLQGPGGLVRFHVRRLEALRRAGYVERSTPIAGTSPRHHRAGHGLRSQPRRSRPSDSQLEPQISSDGATWLDRELVADTPTPFVKTGLGREAAWALDRRAERLVDTGQIKREVDGSVLLPRELIATLLLPALQTRS